LRKHTGCGDARLHHLSHLRWVKPA
jgi:hypothetical protein